MSQTETNMATAINNAKAAAPGKKAKAAPAKASAAPKAPARQVATAGQREVIGFRTAAREIPDATMVANIVRAFGLPDVDYDAIRETTEEMVARCAIALKGNLSDKAIEMHLGRIVDAHVRSAHGAGVFYGNKAKLARDLNSKVANEDRDEDRMGVDGTSNDAERAREFAAQMAVQAFALLAAAEGAVDAYAQVTGSDWKPYQGTSRPAMAVDRQAAAAQLAALGF